MTEELRTKEELFYVVSVNHTHRRDRYITFWRPDDRGYAYPLSWAGKYPRSAIKLNYHNSGHCAVAVPCDVVDPLAVAPEKGMIDNDAGPVVINNAANWKAILSATIAEPSKKPQPEYRGARRRVA